MNKPSVDPAFTFAVSLVLSLVLWYPTMQGTLHGEVDIPNAGIRYFLALALSWAGVYGICSLVAMYASTPRRPSPTPLCGATADGQQRRHDDQPTNDDEEAAA